MQIQVQSYKLIYVLNVSITDYRFHFIFTCILPGVYYLFHHPTSWAWGSMSEGSNIMDKCG